MCDFTDSEVDAAVKVVADSMGYAELRPMQNTTLLYASCDFYVTFMRFTCSVTLIDIPLVHENVATVTRRFPSGPRD